MNRSVVVASLVVTAFVVSAVIGGRTASSQAPAPATTDHRYSTQMVIGVEGLLWAITDHREQRLYVYRSPDKDLVLMATIDLANTGEPTIEVAPAGPPDGEK